MAAVPSLSPSSTSSDVFSHDQVQVHVSVGRAFRPDLSIPSHPCPRLRPYQDRHSCSSLPSPQSGRAILRHHLGLQVLPTALLSTWTCNHHTHIVAPCWVAPPPARPVAGRLRHPDGVAMLQGLCGLIMYLAWLQEVSRARGRQGADRSRGEGCAGLRCEVFAGGRARRCEVNDVSLKCSAALYEASCQLIS